MDFLTQLAGSVLPSLVFGTKTWNRWLLQFAYRVHK